MWLFSLDLEHLKTWEKKIDVETAGTRKKDSSGSQTDNLESRNNMQANSLHS